MKKKTTKTKHISDSLIKVIKKEEMWHDEHIGEFHTSPDWESGFKAGMAHVRRNIIPAFVEASSES